jgi:dolichol-phosphate mannosyltransferase
MLTRAKMRQTGSNSRSHMENPRSKLLVVVPTYIEKENIEELISVLLNLEEKPHILVIDDHSPDGTGDLVQEISLVHPGQIFLIRREAKLGIGSAHVRGFKFGLENNYPYVLTMDADFSHHPKYISQMLRLAGRADIVIGSRYVTGGGTRNWGIVRPIFSRTANFLAKNMLRLRARDCTAGFRLYRKEVLSAIDFDSIYSQGYSFLIEVLYKCQRKGFTIAEVPIIFENRKAGPSKISKWEIVKAVQTLVKFWHERP